MQSAIPGILRVAVGFVIGFASRPLIMGCLHSTEAHPPVTNLHAHPQPKQQQPEPYVYAAEPTPPLPNRIPLDTHVTALPADPDADPSGQVLSVPRAAVTVSERERAELRVKNLRDKLHSNITRTEDVLQDEARMAIRFRREGRDTSARVLLQRRVMLKAKVSRAEFMLSGVMDMIDGLEQAQDNKRLVEALDRGTFAINEIAKDVSVERMEEALADSRAAVEYVEAVNKVVHAEANDMSDADFESLMTDVENEFADDVDTAAGRVDAPDIPDVPAEMPQLPEMPLPEMPQLPELHSDGKNSMPTPAT